jgi:catechol 2,3-dioxygenase-like lactoylglutathione lyase family enzyme
MIKKLHHAAYRCRDSAQTRAFYEDILGLPLVAELRLSESRTGRAVEALHTFYRLDDGSCLAFFEVPEQAFEFKEQHDFDLHIALEVDAVTLQSMYEKCRAAQIETRGIIDHGIIDSVYLRDPNGYVIELCALRVGHDAAVDAATRGAHAIVEAWQQQRSPAASPV